VSLDTSQSRITEIVARAKREHPYEVPGISTRPITGGNPDYLAWIRQQTTGTSTAARTAAGTGTGTAVPDFT
jgi:periplasmic divalent cation tolerance protein